MQRAEVRIIETQSEEIKSAEISNWEKQQLLAKYGYSNSPTHYQDPQSFNPTSDLSYEELMRLEDQKYHRELEQKLLQNQNRPSAYTFDSDQIRFNETKWSNAEDANFGFEVKIVSDMKIPGWRN
jgi:hypothetical protein